jgi:hypothetical protein
MMEYAQFCDTCGFRYNEKTTCLWCYGVHDERFDFDERQIAACAKRFLGMSPRERTRHVIALGLEGFTPHEIYELTNADPIGIEDTLAGAGVFRRIE